MVEQKAHNDESNVAGVDTSRSAENISHRESFSQSKIVFIWNLTMQERKYVWSFTTMIHLSFLLLEIFALSLVR